MVQIVIFYLPASLSIFATLLNFISQNDYDHVIGITLIRLMGLSPAVDRNYSEK